MNAELRFGLSESFSIELPEDAALEVCDAPRGESLADVAAAAEGALAEPLDFPPLARTALPGDRVVLAVEHAVPRVATIVARAVAALIAAGVSPRDIHIVQAAEPQDDLLGEVPGEIRREITSALHDPNSREALSYLAAASDARPIYLNRAIHDADLVVSIGSLRLDDAPGYHGANAGLFPTFSDAATIARYRSSRSDETGPRRRLDRKSDEVTWLLGARFMIQVVPGEGDEVLHVLAGDCAAVISRGRELCEAAWRYSIAKPARLVVATIEGGATSQTWENVGRALASAGRALEPGGAIALCTQLAEAPGAALQRMLGAEDRQSVARDIDQGRPADALVARQLADALDLGSIYLVSRLDAELVEELGLVPLSGSDLSRLARRFDSCLVLANAHYALARIGSGAARRRSRVSPKSPK